MKKLIFFAALITTCFSISKAQQNYYWEEYGGSSPAIHPADIITAICTGNGGKVYASFLELANNKLAIAVNNGGAWFPSYCPDTVSSYFLQLGEIMAIATDNSNNVYMGGDLHVLGFALPKWVVVKWDGFNWSLLPIDTLITGPGEVHSIACDAMGNVYVGGTFTQASNQACVLKWDGIQWSALTGTNQLFGPNNSYNTVNQIVVTLLDTVYANGCYTQGGHTYMGVSKWTGSTWLPVDSTGVMDNTGLGGYEFCYGNDDQLYGIGYTGTNNSQTYIGKWNNNRWQALGNFQPLIIYDNKSICADSHGYVYVAIDDLDSTGYPYVEMWNGVSWNELRITSPTSYPNSSIYSIICSPFDDLYVTGAFKDPLGYPYVAHISQIPSSPLYAFVTATPASCSQQGSAIATAMGGTPPYTYLWNNGANTASNSSLSPGFYWVTVKDNASHIAIGYANVDSTCAFIVYGTAYLDSNQTCNINSNSTPIASVPICLTDSNHVSFYGTTDALGQFIIRLPAAGNYVISSAFNFQCTQVTICSGTNNTLQISGSPGDSTFVLLGFASPSFDLTLHPNWSQANPGFQQNYWIYPENLSAIPYNGTITVVFYYDPNLIYTGPLGPYPIVDTVAHSVTWTQINTTLSGGAWGQSLAVNFTVPASLSPSYLLQNTFSITPTSGDCNAANNIFVFSSPLSSSHDPNAKEVYPTGNVYEEDSVLTYTIHFQNTGTDSTHFVVIKDQLSPYLDAGTVTNLTSSHPYSDFTITGQGLLTWTFNHLRIPDSTIDANGSKGFIMFSVKKKAAVPTGTAINNSASIYFDYNTAVITNTVTDTIQQHVVTSAKELNDGVEVTAYPNPFTSSTHFRVIGVSDKYDFELYDVTGRLKKRITSIEGNQFELHRDNMAAGIYFFRINNAKQSAYGRVVVD